MNGVSLERAWGSYDNGARWPDRLAVTPGRHHLAVVYSLLLGQKAWWADVALDVEAGRHYVIKGDGARMWVVDSASGAVVARALPRTRGVARFDPCP